MTDLDELKAEWFDFGRKSGIKETEERIIKIANDWINEANGHDGECDCKNDAIVLEKFVSYLQA
jgi:hypothetical protein